MSPGNIYDNIVMVDGISWIDKLPAHKKLTDDEFRLAIRIETVRNALQNFNKFNADQLKDITIKLATNHELNTPELLDAAIQKEAAPKSKFKKS